MQDQVLTVIIVYVKSRLNHKIWLELKLAILTLPDKTLSSGKRHYAILRVGIILGRHRDEE